MKQIRRLCCFIILYFGKLPNNMPAFLKSAAANPEYDWMIFTNDRTQYEYAENIHVRCCSFSEMRQRIQNKFDFPIALSTPRKLCDFKPAYGYIFEHELKNYDFWGYCDLDQYFGRLNHFIPRSFLEQYDKIFSLGHMTIYRNTHDVNRLFMDSYNSKTYVDVYSLNKNCCFDEVPNDININVLAEMRGGG